MLEKGDENVTPEVWAQGPPCRKTEMGEYFYGPKSKGYGGLGKDSSQFSKTIYPTV